MTNYRLKPSLVYQQKKVYLILQKVSSGDINELRSNEHSRNLHFVVTIFSSRTGKNSLSKDY